MQGENEHNLGAEGVAVESDALALVVSAKKLPMIITLELEDGSKKRYHLSFAKKAAGLILNKAV